MISDLIRCTRIISHAIFMNVYVGVDRNVSDVTIRKYVICNGHLEQTVNKRSTSSGKRAVSGWHLFVETKWPLSG